ncbi:inhibin beta C chain [Hyalella azteca]|uniref:Inhibin beta C chain n=1 Tax=Hyalella azteca TaxID=294128 RepID=A0A8B7NHK6_HYAAZ|nr:inhibin beta C chain [Hyalella azteca]
MAVVSPVNTILLSYPHTIEMVLVLALLIPGKASPIVADILRLSQDPNLSLSSLSNRDRSPLSDIRISDVVNHLNDTVTELKAHLLSNNTDQEDDASKCAKCSLRLNGPPELKTEEEKDTVRELRLELVKAQILSKLRLSEPPNVTESLNLPREVISSLPNMEAEIQVQTSPPTETSKVIVADTRVACPRSSPRTATCYHFTLPSGLVSSGASHSSVFFQVPETTSEYQHQQALVSVTKVSSSGNHNHRSRHHHHPRVTSSPQDRVTLTSQLVTRPENGWVSVDVATSLLAPLEPQKPQELRKSLHAKKMKTVKGFPDSVQDISLSENGGIILEIFCRHCKHPRKEVDDFMPFLSVRVTDKVKARSRRSPQDCTAGARGCCRDSLYVSFVELGWHNWIIQPQGFTMYFCKGSCAQPSVAETLEGGNSYVSLLQRILLTDALSPTVRAAVAPCCSAQRSEPLSIMWHESPNTVKLQNLPDMIVTECSCAG